jgi:hypothetical protein
MGLESDGGETFLNDSLAAPALPSNQLDAATSFHQFLILDDFARRTAAFSFTVHTAVTLHF